MLDFHVAALYGVETKRVNEAVRNNPRKFPEGYVFELTKEESAALRSKISTIERVAYRNRQGSAKEQNAALWGGVK